MRSAAVRAKVKDVSQRYRNINDKGINKDEDGKQEGNQKRRKTTWDTENKEERWTVKNGEGDLIRVNQRHIHESKLTQAHGQASGCGRVPGALHE